MARRSARTNHRNQTSEPHRPLPAGRRGYGAPGWWMRLERHQTPCPLAQWHNDEISPPNLNYNIQETCQGHVQQRPPLVPSRRVVPSRRWLSWPRGISHPLSVPSLLPLYCSVWRFSLAGMDGKANTNNTGKPNCPSHSGLAPGIPF